jgi:hypothetical protein
MSQLDVRLNESKANQIYYDVTSSNFQSSTVKANPFSFNESRTIPYLMNPSDYDLSILRFTVDTGTLPILIPSIQPNQPDKDLTIYSVTLSYTFGGTIYNQQEFVMWRAQDDSAEVPLAPQFNYNGLQNNTTGYYNCYSYQYFMFLIYEAFQLATTNLIAQFPALNIPYSPLIDWDSSSNRATLYLDSYVFDQNPLNVFLQNPTPVEVYFNAALYGLIPFAAQKLGVGLPSGKEYRIYSVNIGGTNVSPLIPIQADPAITLIPYTSYLAIQLYQEVSTTSSMSPIVAIVFTSNTLPVEANIVSTPVNLNNNQQLSFVGNNAATANIITDLVSNTGVYIPNLVFTPTAEFRRITLYGNTPLVNLDLEIFYRLRNGELIPFTLASGGSVTLKLAFLKKNKKN